MINLFVPRTAGPDDESVAFDLPFLGLDSELDRLFTMEFSWRRGLDLDREFRSESAWLTRAAELLRISWVARLGASHDTAFAILSRMEECPEKIMASRQLAFWAARR